uniref:Uncharacterized protein n=1 Tax=Anguilla anguilla TaxID=7936 RepID=A0A0E9UXV7_ANGAN
MGGMAFVHTGLRQGVSVWQSVSCFKCVRFVYLTRSPVHKCYLYDFSMVLYTSGYKEAIARL